MSDIKYIEISQPLSAHEQASLVLSGSLTPTNGVKTKRVRLLNPQIKEWKICESCGLSFYRTEGSKRKYCARESCTEALFCVRLPRLPHGQ